MDVCILAECTRARVRMYLVYTVKPLVQEIRVGFDLGIILAKCKYVICGQYYRTCYTKLFGYCMKRIPVSFQDNGDNERKEYYRNYHDLTVIVVIFGL